MRKIRRNALAAFILSNLAVMAGQVSAQDPSGTADGKADVTQLDTVQVTGRRAADRAAIDAVILCVHFLDAASVRHVYLRSAVRPPVAFRDPARSPRPAADPPGGFLWELPAGLVEASEQSETGLRRAAQREIREELGFDVPLDALVELGVSVFPVPAFIAERHFYFEAEVDPTTRNEPSLDGSALEHAGVVISLPLADALSRCKSGDFQDAKTELCLRRLAERYPEGAR